MSGPPGQIRLARARRPATTLIWKDRKEAICDKVTIPVVDQPEVEERLQRLRRAVARMEHQQMHVLESRGETRPEGAAKVRSDAIERPRLVLTGQRAYGVAAVGAFDVRVGGGVDRGLQLGRRPGDGQSRL